MPAIVLTIPVVFVQGTRDPFATVPELETARQSLSAPTALVVAEGAAHDLTAGARGRARVAGLAGEALTALRALLR